MLPPFKAECKGCRRNWQEAENIQPFVLYDIFGIVGNGGEEVMVPGDGFE
jgi:hypothetical protein